MSNKANIRRLTVSGLFAAVSAVLMFIEFPLPFLPPFLKIDLSGVPILIAAFLLGPIHAIFITLIKDAVHLFATQTGGVGELADFIMTSCFAVVASSIYRMKKDKLHAYVACALATLSMAAVGVVVNMLILIPFYSKMMPIEAIVSMCSAINPSITNLNGYYIYAVIPFNLIKGTLISILTIILYRRLSNQIKKFEEKLAE